MVLIFVLKYRSGFAVYKLAPLVARNVGLRNQPLRKSQRGFSFRGFSVKSRVTGEITSASLQGFEPGRVSHLASPRSFLGVQVVPMGLVAVCIVVLGVVAMFATAALSWIVSWYPM